MTNTLRIDDKYSVQYDPRNNDRPVQILRYGKPWADWIVIAGHNNFLAAMFYALLEKQWVDVDPDSPPATHMIAIYDDGCSAETLTKFDNDEDFFLGEDGHRMTPTEVSGAFSKWMPAPSGFEPHFMTLTGD